MTVPHYGKREPGSLTAASPGDTLYFNFGSYNDSGDSEAMTGFAITDIEVFKNGIATTRATDSGYSLISDTGQVGDRVGLHRFSIQLFNTTDDTGHYDFGSWYQVAVDAVTIDGKSVRSWVGSFEIGRQTVNLTHIAGSTVSTSSAQLGVNVVNAAGTAWGSGAITAGVIAADAIGASELAADAATEIGTAVWASGTRTLTAATNIDTGTARLVWELSQSAFSDTGSFAYAQGRIMKVLGDTGAAHLDQGRYGVISDSGRQAAVLDTGKVASAIWTSHATRTLTSYPFLDTGVAETVWRYTDTDARMVNVKAIQNDTGAAAHLQQALLNTGFIKADLRAVLADTGAAHLDAGRLGVSATATLDTGVINRAVWVADASRTLTSYPFLDTGVAETVWRYTDTDARMVNVRAIMNDTGAAAHLQQAMLATGMVRADLRAVLADTGAAHLDAGRLGVSAAATVDTGQVNRAVWNADASRTLTSYPFLDTGVAETVWRYSDTDARMVNVKAIQNDTGAAAHLQQAMLNTGRIAADIRAVLADTGAAHLDQGRFGVISDSGRQAAVLDTGKVAAAVWTSHATRALTAFGFDTGVADTVWKSSQSAFSDTGSFAYAQGRIMKVLGDTGAAHLDQGRYGVISDSGRQAAVLDTGKVAAAIWTSHATRTLTAATNIDTGTARLVWELSQSAFSDTGSFAYAQGRLMKVLGDTGAAHLDQGRLGVISDSGRQAAVLDTGKVAAAVWTSHATRTLTEFQFDTGVWGSNFAGGRTLTSFLFDTGVADTVWKYTDTDARRVNVRALMDDTGAAAHIAQAFATLATLEDTGVTAATAAIKAKTDSLTFTTAGQVDANIQYVNDVQVQGAGDTGTGNTWRPV